MTLFDNPAYQLAIAHDNIEIYLPVNIMEGYHQRRYAEAINQNIYAGAGATPEVINTVCDEIILRCNKATDSETRMTDIAALSQSLKYRTKYPVDQHCLIRMGAILSFAEIKEGDTIITEDPNDCQAMWIERKTQLALKVPEMYSFFLNWGLRNTPAYDQHLDTLTDSAYFQKRTEAIKMLLPERLHHLADLFSS